MISLISSPLFLSPYLFFFSFLKNLFTSLPILFIFKYLLPFKKKLSAFDFGIIWLYLLQAQTGAKGSVMILAPCQCCTVLMGFLPESGKNDYWWHPHINPLVPPPTSLQYCGSTQAPYRASQFFFLSFLLLLFFVNLVPCNAPQDLI